LRAPLDRSGVRRGEEREREIGDICREREGEERER
jgi:hypothetical protein